MDDKGDSGYIVLSRVGADIVLEVLEDILKDAFFQDIAAVVLELRESMGLPPTALTEPLSRSHFNEAT